MSVWTVSDDMSNPVMNRLPINSGALLHINLDLTWSWLHTNKGRIRQALFLKARSSKKPVSLGVASLEQVVDLVELDPRIVKFVEAFPRGSLSVIYPAKKRVDERLGGESIAIRVFEHPSARALSKAIGPITATSANEAGEEPADTVRQAAEELGLPEIAIIPGNRQTGPGSTFVKIDMESDEPLVTIIRGGVVPARDVVTWWKNRH